jgi:hypothetical protein
MFLKLLSNNRAFSLLEILVALTLGASLYGLYQSSSNTSREALDTTMNDIERAVRFSVDEAALRNRMVRIHFLFDKEPQEYAVEYGPDDNFVVPAAKSGSFSSLSEKEQKQAKKSIDTINKKFNRVNEFSEGNRGIDDMVKLLGVGTSISKDITTEFHSSVYVYPTGEKDGAIIILATDDEIGVLTMDPFTQDFKRVYQTLNIDADTQDEFETQKQEMAIEIYKDWLKSL